MYAALGALEGRFARIRLVKLLPPAREKSSWLSAKR